jgi:hypothetical protein
LARRRRADRREVRELLTRRQQRPREARRGDGSEHRRRDSQERCAHERDAGEPSNRHTVDRGGDREEARASSRNQDRERN